jgi:DNA polymerase-3 subunit beta
VQVTIGRDALLAACRLAGRLLPLHPLSPAQEHFLLRAGTASAGSLHAAGPETSLRIPLALHAEQPGEALLPACATVAVLRAAAADEVHLESSDRSLLLRWPGARYRLPSPATAIFPLEEPAGPAPSLLFSARELSRAVRSTLFAAAGSCSRRFRLDGVLVEAEPGRLRIVATDNRRLAVAELPASSRGAGHTPQSRVLPAVAVAVLALLAEASEGAVELRLGAERVSFALGEALLTCRCEAGAFPPWRSAVPASPPCRLEVPVAGLLAAVRQAAVLRRREGTRLLLSLEPGRLVLESGGDGEGCARVARKVAYRGGCVRVALEPRCLVELLRCLEGEELVELGLTGADTPALFRAGGYSHVLMPLRLE